MEPLPHEWFLRITKAGGKPFSSPSRVISTLEGAGDSAGVVAEGSVRQELRCCICWQNPLLTKAKEHGSGACPMLASFNKLRKKAKLLLLVTTRVGLVGTLGRESVTAESVAQDYEEYRQEVSGVIAGLESRLRLVKAATGLQPGAGVAGPSAAPEKRKKKKKDMTKGKVIGHSGARAGGGAKGKKKYGPPPPNTSTNVPSGITECEE